MGLICSCCGSRQVDSRDGQHHQNLDPSKPAHFQKTNSGRRSYRKDLEGGDNAFYLESPYNMLSPSESKNNLSTKSKSDKFFI